MNIKYDIICIYNEFQWHAFQWNAWDRILLPSSYFSLFPLCCNLWPFSDQFHNTLKSLHALLYPLCIVFYPIMFICVCTVLEFFIIMQCPIARLLWRRMHRIHDIIGNRSEVQEVGQTEGWTYEMGRNRRIYQGQSHPWLSFADAFWASGHLASAFSLCIWHRPWHRPDVERRLNWPANVAHRQTKRRDNDSAQAELISLETPRSAKRRDAWRLDASAISTHSALTPSAAAGPQLL